jgi:hypothetical protein
MYRCSASIAAWVIVTGHRLSVPGGWYGVPHHCGSPCPGTIPFAGGGAACTGGDTAGGGGGGGGAAGDGAAACTGAGGGGGGAAGAAARPAHRGEFAPAAQAVQIACWSGVPAQLGPACADGVASTVNGAKAIAAAAAVISSFLISSPIPDVLRGGDDLLGGGSSRRWGPRSSSARPCSRTCRSCRYPAQWWGHWREQGPGHAPATGANAIAPTAAADAATNTLFVGEFLLSRYPLRIFNVRPMPSSVAFSATLTPFSATLTPVDRYPNPDQLGYAPRF